MTKFKNIVLIFLLLVTNLSFTQSCNFDDLVRDLSSEGSSFKKNVEQENGFQAWRILAVEAPDFRTNLDEIDLVSKNLTAIKNAGGYIKWENAIGAGKLGVIDDAIKSVAPYLDELKDVGVSVRKMATAETEALDLIKSSNNIKPEVNIAKAEVNLKNGQSYTSHATSGYPSAQKGNILTNPPGAVHPK
ncbi:hypothetical protein [Flavobacterium davisii]|uniref:Uncharacterized protein n=1 Tax=Flavobacterium columnare TaxID=996 RepID=A0A8G0KXK1_9FLAO|nr:hypothetical protein [Flavobacterium davisii]QYS89455.1 hypothetical protein JJC05_04015 [Flavobacterium davisii]